MRYFISYSQDLGPNRGEIGDSIDARFNDPETAIARANDAYESNKNDFDYKGCSWSVYDTQTEETIYTTPKIPL
jgi:hypothetical protein